MNTAIIVTAALLLCVAVAPAAEAPPLDTTVCVSIAEAAKQDAVAIAAGHLTAIVLSPTDIVSFNALLDNIFNDKVDLVTLFVYPDRHAEFTIGNKALDIKCAAPTFVLSRGQVAELMRVIKSTGI